MKARITISYQREKDAKAVVEAISPDNMRGTELTIKTIRRENKVITHIRCEKGLETLIATIDDLLMAIQVVERAISVRIFSDSN